MGPRRPSGATASSGCRASSAGHRLHSPLSLGPMARHGSSSRQRKPLRLMKIIPLKTRRSSLSGHRCAMPCRAVDTRLAPLGRLPCNRLPGNAWDLGKKGSRRAICAPVSQKRSLISQRRSRSRESRSAPRNQCILILIEDVRIIIYGAPNERLCQMSLLLIPTMQIAYLSG